MSSLKSAAQRRSGASTGSRGGGRRGREAAAALTGSDVLHVVRVLEGVEVIETLPRPFTP